MSPKQFSFQSLLAESPNSVAEFCAGADDPDAASADLLGCFADRSLRPEWCWRAVDESGATAALLYWWGKPDAERPILLHCKRPCPAEPGAALVEHSRAELGLTEARSRVVVPGDSGTVAGYHPDRAALLAATGFEPEIERVRVEWTPGVGVPQEQGLLRIVPAAALTERDLVTLFAAVGDGSLDHTSTRRRAELGRDAEAAERLAEARGYHGERDWFAVGLTSKGTPAGYVVSALVDGDRPILAELGVAEGYRGNRYSGELLARGTRVLAEWGAPRIRADTDLANTPMRAAFAVAGYREFALSFDYRWTG